MPQIIGGTTCSGRTATQHTVSDLSVQNPSLAWLPRSAQIVGDCDEQQKKLYQEATEEATEMLVYLMTAGLGAIYQYPAQLKNKAIEQS